MMKRFLLTLLTICLLLHPFACRAITDEEKKASFDAAVSELEAWQPGATCPAAQRSASHCNNPPQLRWNLHLERAVGPRLNAALDIHNLLDTQPTNYLPGNGGQAVGLDDPLGRYFMLTLQFR